MQSASQIARNSASQLQKCTAVTTKLPVAIPCGKTVQNAPNPLPECTVSYNLLRPCERKDSVHRNTTNKNCFPTTSARRKNAMIPPLKTTRNTTRIQRNTISAKKFEIGIDLNGLLYYNKQNKKQGTVKNRLPFANF